MCYPLIKKGTILITLLTVLLCVPILAEAADTGITIQTSRSSSYKGTMPLRQSIQDQLGANENSDSFARIGNVLKNLREGDILVLAVHSNQQVFGVGDQVVPWNRFWSTFGIERPPRLGAVIIGGCMTLETGTGIGARYAHVTESELNGIRSIFNARAIFAPVGEVKPAIAMHDTDNLLRAMFTNKKLAEIDLQRRWHYVADPTMNRNTATLSDLRGKSLQDCLCKCLEPYRGAFRCRYDIVEKGTSPSCRDLKNGPCYCKAEPPSPGCFRKAVPTSGECYKSCMQRFSAR